MFTFRLVIRKDLTDKAVSCQDLYSTVAETSVLFSAVSPVLRAVTGHNWHAINIFKNANMNGVDAFGMQGQRIPGRGKCKCKGLTRGRSLACWRNTKKVREPEEEQKEVGSDRETGLPRSWSVVPEEATEDRCYKISCCCVKLSLFSPSPAIWKQSESLGALRSWKGIMQRSNYLRTHDTIFAFYFYP